MGNTLDELDQKEELRRREAREKLKSIIKIEGKEKYSLGMIAEPELDEDGQPVLGDAVEKFSYMIKFSIKGSDIDFAEHINTDKK